MCQAVFQYEHLTDLFPFFKESIFCETRDDSTSNRNQVVTGNIVIVLRASSEIFSGIFFGADRLAEHFSASQSVKTTLKI